MTEYISRNHGGKEFEVIIKTDSREHYESAEEFARKLIDHGKPKNGVDVIRSMNVEELADYLLFFFTKNMDANGIGHGDFTGNVKRELIADLLKPVKVAERKYKARLVEENGILRMVEPSLEDK